MKWEEDADKALRKVPFFVRARVRRRVEEEASSAGSGLVTLRHLKACQQRYLHRMEEEVRGYQVETCFGHAGCPNRAAASDDLPRKLEDLLGRRKLKQFLEERVPGKLKMHHEFRVSCSDCPNACSRPQIADIGLIGASRPRITDEECTECGECVEVCREDAVSLHGGRPVVDFDTCLDCGQCIRVCPTGTLTEGESGFRVLAGGKLGRHPKLAKEITGIHGEAAALKIFETLLDHYQRHCRAGERFGEILERTGFEILREVCAAEPSRNRPG